MKYEEKSFARFCYTTIAGKKFENSKEHFCSEFSFKIMFFK